MSELGNDSTRSCAPAGCTLVLLPGLDGTEVFFRPLLAQLPASIPTRVIVFPDRGPSSYEALLEMVRDALSEVSSCVVLGSSFSGPLAVMLAAAETEKVRGLILAASFLRAPRRHPGWVRPIATTPVVAALRTARRLPVWLLRAGSDPLRIAKRETWARVPAWALAARSRAVLKVDARASLERCRQPVLAAVFSEDRVVPRPYSEEILRHSRAARLVVLPGGHLAMFSDPAPLATETVRFFETVVGA